MINYFIIKQSKGDTAPNFVLQNTEGNKIELYNLLNKKQVVLLFFPLAFTDTCTKELCSVRDNMKIYNSVDANIVGISVDSFFVLKEYKKTNNLNFTLLSDFNREASQKYGILYDDFYGMQGVSKRSTFIIGKDKKIRYVEVLENASDLPDFGLILEALGINGQVN